MFTTVNPSSNACSGNNNNNNNWGGLGAAAWLNPLAGATSSSSACANGNNNNNNQGPLSSMQWPPNAYQQQLLPGDCCGKGGAGGGAVVSVGGDDDTGNDCRKRKYRRGAPAGCYKCEDLLCGQSPRILIKFEETRAWVNDGDQIPVNVTITNLDIFDPVYVYVFDTLCGQIASGSTLQAGQSKTIQSTADTNQRVQWRGANKIVSDYMVAVQSLMSGRIDKYNCRFSWVLRRKPFKLSIDPFIVNSGSNEVTIVFAIDNTFSQGPVAIPQLSMNFWGNPNTVLSVSALDTANIPTMADAQRFPANRYFVMKLVNTGAEFHMDLDQTPLSLQPLNGSNWTAIKVTGRNLTTTADLLYVTVATGETQKLTTPLHN